MVSWAATRSLVSSNQDSEDLKEIVRDLGLGGDVSSGDDGRGKGWFGGFEHSSWR
jgi:hypothetical protein